MGLLGKVDKYLHILSHSMIRFTRLLCGKSICKNMRDHKPALILEKKEILSSPRVCFVSLKFCQPTIKWLITKTTLRHKHKISGSRFTQHRSISHKLLPYLEDKSTFSVFRLLRPPFVKENKRSKSWCQESVIPVTVSQERSQPIITCNRDFFSWTFVSQP